MSGPRMGMSHMNGSNRRPNIHRSSSTDKSTCAQHDDLIRYIFDSWSKVETDCNSGGNTVLYYKEQENHNLKDFRPFDLEAYWGRRLVQTVQQTHKS